MTISLKTHVKAAPDSDVVRKIFNSLCRLIDSPLARSLKKLDDAALVRSLSIDPSTFTDANDFRQNYLLVSYLSKYKGLNTMIDTKAVALASFTAGESVCASTNLRFRQNRPSIVDPVIYRARQLVAKLLGPFDKLKLDGGERWGPGSTTDLSRRRAYLDTKMVKLPIPVTAECFLSLRETIQQDLHWSELILGHFPTGPYSLLSSCFEMSLGSDIITVDKNAKTDRTIAVEPRGNMFMQKAAGSYIRKRLKRVGVDLDDQGLNQKLAAEALALDLATIDLSMASDTISSNFVMELLPFEWYNYLDKIRSRSYKLEDAEGYRGFEKFSSMGNGFTFELESLLFWALTKASMSDEADPFAIYGDDIILPSSDAPVLVCVLAYCGFKTNDDKSFVDGPFRESCGRHFFNGEDVTPIYQKEVVLDLQSHIRFLNRLKRYAVKHASSDRLEPIVNSVWRKQYVLLRGWRPSLPLGTEGDNGYLVAHDDLEQDLGPEVRGIGHRWQIIVERTSGIPADERALLAYRLRLTGQVSKRSEVRPMWSCLYDTLLPDTPPFKGDIESRDEKATVLARTTRWIEPSWEFSLDSR